MNTVRISIKEKFSYGLGDTGCNLVWQTVMLFMAWFYTDVFGLSPAYGDHVSGGKGIRRGDRCINGGGGGSYPD